MKSSQFRRAQRMSVVLTLLLVGSTLFVAMVIPASNAKAPLALDGSNIDYGCSTGTTCATTLATTSSPDVIVADITVSCSGSSCTPPTTSSVTASGLTFYNRGIYNRGTSSVYGTSAAQWYIAEYYAIASGTLSSLTITANYAAAPLSSSIVVFGVSGAATTGTIFDGCASGAVNMNEGTATTVTVSCTTTNANDMIIISTGMVGTPAAGSCCTLIKGDGGNAAHQDPATEYDIVSSTQSGASFTFTGQTASKEWIAMADAIKQASSSTTTTTNTATTSSTSTTTTASQSSSVGIAIDGSAINYACANTATCSAILKTVYPNDLIIASITVANSGSCAAPPTVSGFTDSQSLLSFSKRGSVVSGCTGGGTEWDLEEWYSPTTSLLTSDTITVTASSTSHEITIIAFGVSGYNAATPFDGCAGGSGVVTAMGTTVSPSVHCTTRNANDLIVSSTGMVASSSACGCIHAVTGFTELTDDNALAAHQDPAADYGVVSATQTNLVTGFIGGHSGFPWVVMSDAVEQASSPTTNNLMIDGSKAAFNTGTSNLAMGEVNTTSTNNVIVLYVSTGTISASACPVTAPPAITGVRDSAGLTWHRRSTGATTSCETSPGPTDTGDGFQVHEEEWYAIAASKLSSDTISVNAVSTASEVAMVEFGVVGANTASPFDPSGSLPCVATGYSTTPACTLSTTGSAMIVMGIASINGFIPSTGYTLMYFLPANVQNMGAMWRVFQPAQSGITPGLTQFGDIASGDDIWAVIGDAIVAAPLTQPIKLTVNEAGAPSQTFTISGCSASPGTISGDGSAHSITMTATHAVRFNTVTQYQAQDSSKVISSKPSFLRSMKSEC